MAEEIEKMFSKLIAHVKSYYIDKDLIKKELIAKDMIHLNCDSVIQGSVSDSHTDNDVSSSSVTYGKLTKREGDAYGDALSYVKRINCSLK